MSSDDPHAGQPVLHRGPDLADARLVVVAVHGRGDSAAGILQLADAFEVRDVAWLAPQAAGNTWYPYSFLAPMERNEPGITSGLRVVERLIGELGERGIPPARVALLGFSQGACLAQEFAARHARRYAGVIGLSGGLIGPPGTPREYAGSLNGTPVFLGCSDVDPHIPEERVRETGAVFERLGGRIDLRIYPGMGHTVNDDEIRAVEWLLTQQ